MALSLRRTARGFAVILVLLGFSSCRSLSVPGEGQARMRSVLREYYSLAKEYEGLKKYDKALSLYEMALSDGELHDAAYYRMGVCYAMQRKWEAAETVFSWFLSRDAENETMLLSLAYVQASAGKMDEAAESYRALYEKNKGSPSLQVLKNYCAVLVAAEDFAGAAAVWLELEEHFPDDAALKPLRENIPDEAFPS